MHDGHLFAHLGIVDEHLHHEAVDLGLRERVRALGLDRVLRGHDEEGVGNRERLQANRDLPLLHDFEQG